VSVREFCITRAAECLLASEQVSLPSDREALLHMAATYFARAIDIELRGAPAPEISVLTRESQPGYPGKSTG
jgi:hypothetical protein